MKKDIRFDKEQNRKVQTEEDINMYLVSKVELVMRRTIKI